jgi:hypothetical protein
LKRYAGSDVAVSGKVATYNGACLGVTTEGNHLKEPPIFESESNISDETCRITVNRGSLDLIDLDIAVRGKLMHHAFEDILP